MDEPTPTKACKKCAATKPLDDFYVRNGRHQAQCKACVLAANYAWRRANPEAGRAATKRWRERNPDKVSAQFKAWREANPEYDVERHRAYRKANPEIIAAQQKRYREKSPERREAHRKRTQEWYAANPDKRKNQPSNSPERVRLRVAIRRARKKANGVGPVDTDSLWLECEGCCSICAEPIDRDLKYPDPMSSSLDHIIPLARGGPHTQENLAWTHLHCNMSKGVQLVANQAPSDQGQPGEKASDEHDG